MDAMTARERWLAALEMKPTDRLPFWPKLDGAYPRAQAAPFDRMDVRALHAWIGSDRWEGIGDGLREVRRRTSAETLRKGDEQRTVYRTPHGSLELVQRFDAPSSSWHPTAFPVRTAADLAILAEWWKDVSYEPDPEAEARAAADRRDFGEDAVVSANVGTTP